MKHTSEQVTALIERLRNTPNWLRDGFVDWKDAVLTHDRSPFKAADMLEDYAALLRERESAKSEPVAWRYRLDGDMQWQHTSDKRICMGEIEPLYAVAPILASAHANQEPYCYTVEQKNGLSQGAMCRTKAECEASPLFDPENEHVIPLYREPVLASARVPDAPLSVFSKGIWIYGETSQTFSKEEMDEAAFIVYRDAMLAAAPKPEVSERHHWLCCGALKPDHSDKPRVMPDCFDPERHVWAVSPKPEKE